MGSNLNGRRGPRHVVGRPKSDRLAAEVRRRIAAETHIVAHANPKRAAARLGLSVRTIQRWHSMDYEGSPYARFLEALEGADDPWTVLAFCEAAARRVVMGLPDKDIATLGAEYRELLAKDAEGEGADNGNKVRRGVEWVDRFFTSRADAKDDLAKAAYELEFAFRGVGEREVFGR